MLAKYKGITGDQHKLQWELRQREGEIAELQNALSDMQVYLFQEREQSLRLYAENDRLKIRELDDRKKIQHLLALVGPDSGEITYFHREPPHKVAIKQIIPETEGDENLCLRPQKPRPGMSKKEGSRKTRSSNGVREENLEQYKKDNETLLLQVEALQAQMEEQTRLAKEQVESLLEDSRIRTEEAQAQQLRDQERLAALSEKLQQTQNLLHDSTRDFLQLKFDTRALEKSWMAEKDKFLRELDSCHQRLKKTSPPTAVPELSRAWQPIGTTAAIENRSQLVFSQQQFSQAHKDEVKALQEDLKQTHRLAEMFREQCVTLETELAQIREEGDVGREIFKERSDKMAQRLQLMTQRYEALEKRRAMEVEGFKTDLKHLRQKLKDVEKQLLKVTLNVGPNQDLAILHEVRQGNSRTKKVQSELMTLKAKIYGLENDLRFN